MDLKEAYERLDEAGAELIEARFHERKVFTEVGARIMESMFYKGKLTLMSVELDTLVYKDETYMIASDRYRQAQINEERARHNVDYTMRTISIDQGERTIEAIKLLGKPAQ